MTTRTLLKQMEFIARKLLSLHEYQKCFERGNKRYIKAWGKSGQISTPFYWCITRSNAELHARHSIKEMTGLFLQIQISLKSEAAEEFVIMEFDGDNLLPVLPFQLLEWAKQQNEYKDHV